MKLTSTQRNHRRLFVGLVLSTVCAVGAVLFDGPPRDDIAERRHQFQQLLGGLGFGATVSLSECCFCFDPRLRPVCSQMEGPLPAATVVCRQHMGRVTEYPHLFRTDAPDRNENSHAAVR